MSLLHTDWIKPNSKRQAIWIAEYLKKKKKKKHIIIRSITPKSDAELVKEILEGNLITKEQRKKMASAWTSHISRTKKKAEIKALAKALAKAKKAKRKAQTTISISNESYEIAKEDKGRYKNAAAYIESLIKANRSSSTAELLKPFQNSKI